MITGMLCKWASSFNCWSTEKPSFLGRPRSSRMTLILLRRARARPSRPSRAQSSSILSSSRLATSGSCKSASSSISRIWGNGALTCSNSQMFFQNRPNSLIRLNRLYWFLPFVLKDKTNAAVFLSHLVEQVRSFGQFSVCGQFFQIETQVRQPLGAQIAGAAFEAMGGFLQCPRVRARNGPLHILNPERRVAQKQVDQFHCWIGLALFSQFTQACQHRTVEDRIGVRGFAAGSLPGR